MLITTADVGDIILCLSHMKYNLKNRCNAIEEVCLIVKLDDEEDGIRSNKIKGQPKKKLYVIRYVQRQGIVLQNWNKFKVIKQHKFFECWHRHLHCKRNQDFLNRTQVFIQNLRDKAKTLNKKDMPLFAEVPAPESNSVKMTDSVI